MARLSKENQMLAEDMARFYADPLGFVMYAYPWNTDKSLQLVQLVEPWRSRYGCDYGPDEWACQFLEDLGAKISAREFDGIHAVDAIRESVVSGHGIGKSALVAWLVDFIMSTRPYAQGTVTANTAPQLRTKTWAQIVKWTKRCITAHWFDITTGMGSMAMRHKQYPDEWFCTAQTCAEENSEAFAGQHAANSTSFYIFDEASKIPDVIDEVSEGGMTDGEPMKFAFGNGTRNTGWFHGTHHGQRHRWGRRQIDSREVQITNKKMLQEWIDDYGVDSDFSKIRIRGMFPSMSAKQFIGVADVDAAFGRQLRKEQYVWAPKIITVDPAWEGDDEFVIGLRQGLKFDILRAIAKNDNDVQMANLVAQLEDEHEADAVFIDAGYGTGIVSIGKALGRTWLLVWFASEAIDKGCLNKRAEMWKLGRDWLKEGGAIPVDQVLYADLIGPETVPRLDGKIQLEAKKDMKRRDLPSPNRADALMLSFAYPVVAEKLKHPAVQYARDHNPYAKSGVLNAGQRGHDPYSQK
jgi:hypothetical protein